MVDPIRFYVLWQIEQFVIRELHLVKQIECRSDIRTTRIRTATAVDNNVCILWQFA